MFKLQKTNVAVLRAHENCYRFARPQRVHLSVQGRLVHFRIDGVAAVTAELCRVIYLVRKIQR